MANTLPRKKKFRVNLDSGHDLPHLVEIVQHGEQILDNTYGFEIEFCSHDNPVLAFTHVKVLTIVITYEGREYHFHVETDSGNVLELVTPALPFASLEDAYEFKDHLTSILTLEKQSKKSMNALVEEPEKLPPTTLGKWSKDVIEKLSCLFESYIDKRINSSMPIKKRKFIGLEIEVKFQDWNQVNSEINLENVDDGINVYAARVRHSQNKGDWEGYVTSTLLSRSEKEWRSGFTSQVNTTFTLPGFLFYSYSKYLDSVHRIELRSTQQPASNVTDDKINRDHETAFWRLLLWNILQSTAELLGLRWKEPEQDWTLKEAWQFGILYALVNKLLTGALGALSEPAQLKLQKAAWNNATTQIMDVQSPDEEETFRTTTRWAEYHSSMKDLTGLWLKAPLVGVIKTGIDTGIYNFRNDAKFVQTRLQRSVFDDCWNAAFNNASNNEDRVFNKIRKYGRQVDPIEFKKHILINKILDIWEKFSQFLVNWNLNRLSNEQAAWLELPDSRKFLHYESAPPWEGRYDTMYPAPITGTTDRFLVEHRFN